MKRSFLAAAAFLLVLPFSSQQTAAQQTAKEAEAPTAPDRDIEKEMMPPEIYSVLGRLAGTWQAELKVLMHGTPPRETKMTDKLKTDWILDKKFLETNFDNGFVKGKVITGYNGITRELFRFRIENQDPRGMLARGVYINSKDALVFRTEEVHPVSRDSFLKREVFTFGPDKDKVYYELFYELADGSEVKPVEGFYTRVPTQ